MVVAMKTVPGEVAPAVDPPRGLVHLYLSLAKRFGDANVDFAPGLARAVADNNTLEVRVTPEEFEAALDLVSELSLAFEREYGERYSVIVVPSQ